MALEMTAGTDYDNGDLIKRTKMASNDHADNTNSATHYGNKRRNHGNYVNTTTEANHNQLQHATGATQTETT